MSEKEFGALRDKVLAESLEKEKAGETLTKMSDAEKRRARGVLNTLIGNGFLTDKEYKRLWADIESM
jgi:hypothetical protein